MSQYLKIPIRICPVQAAFHHCSKEYEDKKMYFGDYLTQNTEYILLEAAHTPTHTHTHPHTHTHTHP